MNTVRRQELVERLLGILVEFIPFQLPDETRDALLEEATGNWVIPHTITTAENIVWKQPSLHWMWQEETGSCCLNFLAHEGFFQWGTVEAFQWTLEASCDSPNVSSASQTEFRRFEPMVLASEDHLLASSPLASPPIRTFWKIASLKVLCVEFPVATLLGTLSKESPSSNAWKLDPEAVFSCDKVALIGKLPSTSNEHIQVAKIISLLEVWKTPQVQWRLPPGYEYIETFTVDSLADIFRRVFTHLEDTKESSAIENESKPGTQGSTRNDTERSSEAAGRLPHRRIDIKKSISDSLIMTGGLAATGASFASPIGAAVSVAAIGVKDGVAAAARKGQESRNGEGYKFGDLTRGIVSSIKEKKIQHQARVQQQNDDNLFCGNGASESASTRGDPSFLQSNKSRYVGVVGSSVGAAVGLTLVGGPLGLLAGSLAGGVATQEAVRRQGETYDLHASDQALSQRRTAARLPAHSTDEEIMMQLEREEQSTNEKKPWKFGDNIRNVVQRGKEAAGRDADREYKPGDFSRGLFARKK